jgi:hypothetical protein
MAGFGMIKVSASVVKGMTIIAKGNTARIVAFVAAIGVVTISIAIAAGTFLVIRSLKPTFQRISLRNSDHPSKYLM